jgi:hypothetical protein
MLRLAPQSEQGSGVSSLVPIAGISTASPLPQASGWLPACRSIRASTPPRRPSGSRIPCAKRSPSDNAPTLRGKLVQPRRTKQSLPELGVR